MEVLFILSNKNGLFLLFACILTIFLLTSVSASDLNESKVVENECAPELGGGNLDCINEDNQGDLSLDDGKLGTTDDSDILKSSYSPKTSSEIQTCVDSAKSGDTIVLDGYYLINNTINVKKQLNFIGINNATIDGNNSVRLFSVSYVDIIFKNITFKNGYTTDYGGAIYSHMCVVSLEGCNFYHNVAKWSGAIYSSGYYSNAINCNFTNNLAFDGSYGAASGCNAYNCIFRNNSAIARYGGAFGGKAINCTFIGNSAKKGGAISGGNVINCSFYHNHADVGGAIYDMSYIIQNSIFYNNSANSGGAISSASAVNCSFIINSANSGGAINSGSATNCSFWNNSALCDGGAMYDGSATNCSFWNNSALGNGGAVCSGSAVNCSFIGNSATFGGAMYGENYNADNCCFIQNTAKNGGSTYKISVTNCNFTNNNATKNGGAIYGGLATYSNFINNHANENGGAVYEGLIANSLFESNSATDGGAISGKKAINSTFNSNVATNYGGAVYNAKVSTNCQFDNNFANVGSDTYDVTFFEIENTFKDLDLLINGNNNDTIYLSSNYLFDISSDSSFQEGIIINRSLTIYGDGHTIDGDTIARIFTVSNNDVIFHDIFFVNGKADGNGAAINGQCSVMNCTFINNHARRSGGAFYGGSAVNCTFIDNSANSNFGAMRGDSVINCTFINNTANYCGALSANSVINSTFINNTADEGGAIARSYSPGTIFIKVINCTFINNFAHYGGAMAGFACYAINCTFIDNSADREGGALHGVYAIGSYFEKNVVTKVFNLGYGGCAMYGSTAINCTFVENSGYWGTICRTDANNCTFINNSASAMYMGNAVNCSFMDGSVGADSTVNCYFYNSDLSGSAVDCYFNNSSLTGSATNCVFVNCIKRAASGNLINCTFANNTGGAVSSSIAIGSTAINCTFINNSASYGGAMVGGTAINCTFINNYATYGGAVYFGGYDHYGGYAYVANLVNCTFIGNSAEYGGAISSHESQYYSGGEVIEIIKITGCRFINNTADYNGGVVEISHPYRLCNISDSIFINNTARKGKGGAVYIKKEGNITNSIFINCSANQGRAIWIESNSNIVLCNFTDCISSDGNGYLGFTNPSLYNVSDCIFDVAPKDVDYYYSSTLTVNSLFIAKGEREYLYVNLSNICGPIVNKKINFMFNGRKFHSITNSEGIAEFNVNNYLTNLGETFINISFTGDELNYPSATCTTVYINKYFCNLTVSLDGEFFNDTFLKFNLVNSITNVPIEGAPIKLNFSNGEIINLTTDFEGNAIYIIPFIPDTYSVYAFVDEDYVTVNNVSVDNIVIKKLVGEIEVTPLNDNHTLMIRLFDPEDSNAIYRNVKINLDVGPKPVVKEELFTNEKGYVVYDLLNFTKGTYSISVSVKGDYKDFYDYYLADYVISNLLNSKLNFSNNITFEFGEFGSCNFTVQGGIVEYGKIRVLDHPEAIIGLSNNVISVSNLNVGDHVLMVETTPDEYHNPINASVNITVTNAKSKVSFSAGIVFEYGSSSSIHVIVEGGKVERKNIRIIGHPEANIQFKGNVITVSGLAVGNYNLQVISTPDSDHLASTGTVRVTVKKATATIKASKITVAYKKGAQWTIKFVDSKNANAIANMKVTLKVFTGKKYKTVNCVTNSRGEVSYQTKGLAKGNHKVVVTASDSRYNFNSYSSSIKVVKQTAVKFKVTKKTAKDGATLSITVMDKKTKKRLNGVKVKLLIKDGKKTNVVILKSMKKGKFKGICGYATNKLSVGTHKVTIMTVDVKYGGFAKSTMKITKKAKKAPAWESKDSAK